MHEYMMQAVQEVAEFVLLFVFSLYCGVEEVHMTLTGKCHVRVRAVP